MPVAPWKMKHCILLLAVAMLGGHTPLRAADDREATHQEQEAEIARLIEQLGSPQFATREKAQSRIQSLGLAVFDALLEAQHHRDIEVARRARYLLRGMPVDWDVDTDPQEVRSLLRNYGQQGRVERLSRIKQLATLNDSLGGEALCRIVRFEADIVLSKQAAIQLMWHHASADLEDRKAIAGRIRAAIGSSRRPAARWLQTYADTLVSSEPTLEEWERITRDELETLVKTPDETQRSVVRDLLRWHVDLLWGLQRNEEVQAEITRIIELVEPNREELFDVVDWALEREAWFVPQLLAERFPAEYWQDELLVYRLAEAKRKSGDEAAAQETAKLALAMNPNHDVLHRDVARRLRYERQMFDWSEAEFRQIIQTAGELHEVELVARGLLAEMLGDLQREREAAETLQPSVEIGEKDPAALASAYELLYGQSFSTADLRAKIDHLLAIHYGREGEVDKQKDLLQKALAVDIENIDIVIALHGVADDGKAWREKVDNLLAEHVQRIESRMKELERILTSNEDRGVRDLNREEFAQKNNEFAWLVSNTAGDYQKAVACSQKSLELVPDSWAYQDTLGRCYYAVGDYKNAIRYQKLAVAQAPYMQQMRRQLKLFEDTLAETAAKAN
ncbi:MAG: hypothetical protein O3C40_00445 [Planctomycetota bacterium]|nr:hypothetical protein [Planctomycetota bacterium]